MCGKTCAFTRGDPVVRKGLLFKAIALCAPITAGITRATAQVCSDCLPRRNGNADEEGKASASTSRRPMALSGACMGEPANGYSGVPREWDDPVTEKWYGGPYEVQSGTAQWKTLSTRPTSRLCMPGSTHHGSARSYKGLMTCFEKNGGLATSEYRLLSPYGDPREVARFMAFLCLPVPAPASGLLSRSGCDLPTAPLRASEGRR